MWHVVAEEDMKCAECKHVIPSGTECLSQMPVAMPEGFRRRKYENLCIYCHECHHGDKAQLVCYARRLNHWNTKKAKVNEPVPCAHRGASIPTGKKAIVQSIYDWPKIDSDENSEPTGKRMSANGKFASSTIAAAGVARPSAVGWHNLSSVTQRKFQTAGLGGVRGVRTPAMAQRLFESIPRIVRNQGEGAVLEFMKGRHASHIRSVVNAPSRAAQPSNIVFESARKNLARGSRNMTATEVSAAKSAGRASAVRIGVKSAVKSGAKAGVIAAAIEAPVAFAENYFHWKRGRKNGEQATKDASKSTAVAGGVGVAAWGATAVAAKGVAMVGISPSLGPLGVPVAVAGVGLLAYTGARRIYKAAQPDLPLDEYYIVLCKDNDCKTQFAQRVVDEALGVDRSAGRGLLLAFLVASVAVFVAVVMLSI